jgi:O-6-methylguanine DNA methyltransferase
VASQRTARIGAALLGEIAASADPDQALRTFGDLIARRGAAWSIWRLLEENPAIVRLLGSIFGASAYLARTLVDTPELIDLLIELGQTPPSRSVAQIAADLAARLAAVDAADAEQLWSAVAEVKNGHVLRVGLADFAGALDALERVPVDPGGTPFQQRVWEALRRIAPGTTMSYAELARTIGAPAAGRAVGAANGANPVCLAIPCHRVIGADGSLTGYAAGVHRKRWLLAHERAGRRAA